MKKLLILLLLISSEAWADINCSESKFVSRYYLQRCENNEAVCYTYGRSISCFPKTKSK